MPANAYFAGDAACLVDRLVDASAAAYAPKEGYTGYGRELTPWCADDGADAGLFGSLEAPRCGVLPRGLVRPPAARRLGAPPAGLGTRSQGPRGAGAGRAPPGRARPKG